MGDTRFDIVAMGDAIVDVIASCDNAFLDTHGLPRGSMQLLSPEAADRLYEAMGQAREMSGGSAANSMAGIAAMGGKAAFIGQVAEDQLGLIFEHDMHAFGVHFDTPMLTGGPPTGRCLILVTPDGQRTMNTSPGASHELTADTLDPDLIRDSAILYLEGYLFGPDKPRAAMMKAVDIAKEAQREVAFTLSESVCITERKDRFTQMVDEGGIDLLFCNEDEAMMLTATSDLDHALAHLAARVPTLVVTRGEHGALALEQGKRVDISAPPPERVLDTTGAGDMFAAGFLVARAKGLDLERCLLTGGRAAADVISRYGARPDGDMREKVGL
ncbi:adenosine kinase [Sphingomicrobium lutaoense]|uniref:Sugar/nucleoside kinase (Ribokinase family) n=1 Tax=Sphingomicrobium lutaoense TaxID=515949 RepID=A0A839Z1E8_9SPHN|nr:adenosine kinase [Sphingomicrobium lutaoense]MBB3763405.1 sugar/nucleoside kinase (ribokinase family) [Sphingomicrobium lutaoense]